MGLRGGVHNRLRGLYKSSDETKDDEQGHAKSYYVVLEESAFGFDARQLAPLLKFNGILLILPKLVQQLRMKVRKHRGGAGAARATDRHELSDGSLLGSYVSTNSKFVNCFHELKQFVRVFYELFEQIFK